MSAGLQLIRSVIDRSSFNDFRRLQPDMFVEAEMPAFDYVTRFSQQFGGLPNLQQLAQNGIHLPEADGPIEYFLDRVDQRTVYRAWQRHERQMQEVLRSNNVGNVREIVETMLGEMRRGQAFRDVYQLPEALVEAWEQYVMARSHPGLSGVTFGYDEVDEVTGGIRPGDVGTIVARPGIGKSFTITRAACSAWRQGRSVLFVSMEMTAIETARRIIAMETGVSHSFVQEGNLSGWGEEHVQAFIERVNNMAPFTMLVGDLSKSIRDVDAMIQEHRPDAVYIDASYLLRPTEGNRFRGKKWEALSEVGEELKSLALTRHVPILQTVQFNRTQHGEEEMDLSQIGGTDVVGQVSSVVIGVKKGAAPYERTRRRYRILKNRHGPDDFYWQTHFQFEPFNMDLIPDDNRGPAGGDRDAPGGEWDGQTGDQPAAGAEWGGNNL